MLPIIAGIAAALALFLAYFAILSIFNSAEHALFLYIQMWPWMSALILGFGIQAGLYVYVRQRAKLAAAASAGACGGISVASMAACCAHHITDFIPVLGISAAALFLTRYQQQFLLIGVLSNLAGLLFMLATIKKHHLYNANNRNWNLLFRLNFGRMLAVMIPAGIIIVAIGFLK